jgi:hypothetical protein
MLSFNKKAYLNKVHHHNNKEIPFILIFLLNILSAYEYFSNQNVVFIANTSKNLINIAISVPMRKYCLFLYILLSVKYFVKV